MKYRLTIRVTMQRHFNWMHIFFRAKNEWNAHKKVQREIRKLDKKVAKQIKKGKRKVEHALELRPERLEPWFQKGDCNER